MKGRKVGGEEVLKNGFGGVFYHVIIQAETKQIVGVVLGVLFAAHKDVGKSIKSRVEGSKGVENEESNQTENGGTVSLSRR